MSSGLLSRLNCTKCGDFTEPERESENVVRCSRCGKRHSTDSLHAVYEDKKYARDEAGELLETTP